MVSTVQPSRRHKKKGDNKSIQNHQHNNHNSSGKSKKRKEQQPTLVSSQKGNFQISSLYTEDLGLEGVKRAKVTCTQKPGPILKGPEGPNFSISETPEERLRRLRRKNRFDKGPHRSNNVPQAKPASALSSFAYKDNSVKNPAEPDFLSKALSSGRKDKPTDNSNQPQQQKQKGQVVGTLQDLEKPYLRLTTYVKPENVRPMSVLIQSLAHIKSKYFQEEDFEWANEQLKSVRQDITVQRLRNKFVLDVYETHARILLEHGDLPEFNQCQTMIRYLTTSGVEPEDAGLDPMGMAATDTDNDSDRTVEPLVQSEEHSDEFRAYHVIYSLVQNSWEDLSKALIRVREIIRNQDGDGSSFMSSSSSSSSSSLSKSSRHSLQVVKSVIHNDYRAFFRLYEAAPHMSAYLMDFLVKRMREKAYERIIAAYRPTICVEHFRETLCFHDMEETRLFLRQLGAVFVKGEPPIWVDCKASSSKKCIHILSM